MENDRLSGIIDTIKGRINGIEIIYSSLNSYEVIKYLRNIMDHLGIHRNTDYVRKPYEIDWKSYSNHYEMFSFLGGKDVAVQEMLKLSDITKKTSVITCGKYYVAKIPTLIFIENFREISFWDIKSTAIFSDDGKYIMEFTHEGFQVLRSNFLIERNEL